MSGKVGDTNDEVVPIGLTGEEQWGIALLGEECQVSSMWDQYYISCIC